MGSTAAPTTSGTSCATACALSAPTHRRALSAPGRPGRADRRRRGGGEGSHHAADVKCSGVSEAGTDTIRRAYAVRPLSVLQAEYSLFEFGIGLVPHSSLGRGFLTGAAESAGQYDKNDMRNTGPRRQPGNFENKLAATEQPQQLAASMKCDHQQARPRLIPRPGKTHRAHPRKPRPSPCAGEC